MDTNQYRPEWIRKKYEEMEINTTLNNKNDQITDFLVLIECIWNISNQEYQERIWVNHECKDIVDSYMDTTMYFAEDTAAILEARNKGHVHMTDKQCEMLKKLYNMINEFEKNPEAPNDGGYGINDKAIIEHPKWDKVRQYAKLVYTEITGEACL